MEESHEFLAITGSNENVRVEGRVSCDGFYGELSLLGIVMNGQRLVWSRQRSTRPGFGVDLG